MKVVYYLISATLFIFFTGCELEHITEDKFGTISGMVVDGENYEPLSGVQISTTPASTIVLTDEEGSFQIERVKNGELVITAKKKDFLTGSVSVAVNENLNTSLTFFLLEDDNDVGNVHIYDPIPGNGAVGQMEDLTLEWKVEQDVRSRELEYNVYIFESNSTTQTLLGENLIGKEIGVSNLKPNTTYFWYVVAKYQGRNVANSPTWTFMTD
ncbi:MAG: carboxypeptidase-like regulatory domain-containing protein [Cyclobacteriaceae bacterium]